MEVEIGESRHALQCGTRQRAGTNFRQRGIEDCLDRLKQQALSSLAFGIELSLWNSRSRRDILSAADVQDADSEMNDGGALLARSQKHWQRPEEEGIDQDDVGRKVTQNHLQAKGLFREKTCKKVFDVEADHLEARWLLLPLRKLFEVMLHI